MKLPLQVLLWSVAVITRGATSLPEAEPLAVVTTRIEARAVQTGKPPLSPRRVHSPAIAQCFS